MSIANDKIVNLQDVKVLYDDLRGRIKESHTYEKSITESSAIQSFEGGAWPMGLQVAVDPVQDLHGYDHPWPGGGGKNLLPLTVDEIKSVNTDGTWSGNVYSIASVAYTINTDGSGNVVSISSTGTATDRARIYLYSSITSTSFTGEYILNGCPPNGNTSTYYMRIQESVSPWATIATDIGSGSETFSVPSSSTYRCFINIANGTNANNLTFYPMLRLSTVSDATFEPYTNICPITGWTGANVSVTGKNLLNQSGTNTGNGYVNGKYLGSSGELLTPTGAWCVTEYARVKPSTKYTLSGLRLANTAYFCEYDEARRFIISHPQSGTTLTFTTSASTAFLRVSRQPGNANQGDTQLEEGDTETAYEPFGIVYPITFPTSAGTVYGGNLTVNKDGTGTLVVDRTSLTIPTIESYDGTVSGTTYNIVNLTPQPSQKKTIEEITTTSDVLQGILYGDRKTKTFGCFGTTSQRIVISVDGSYSVADFNANIAGGRIVYLLDETQSYSLTPGQVLSLIGKNHVWADTGDILSLTYNSKQGIEFIREDTAGQINTVVDPVKTELADAEAAMAIVVDGDTAPKNITSGQYVFVKNHSTLATGMYHATANISSGASVTSNNVEADADGVINSLTVAQDISSAFSFAVGWGGAITAYKCGRIISLIVVASTHPTLAANTRYTNVVLKSGAAYSPIIQLHATGWQSDNFRDFGNIVHCSISDTATVGFNVATGDDVNDNPIRFYVMYIAQA